MLRIAAGWTWAMIALTGFILSLAVHVPTYFGVSLTDRIPNTWMLHLGIFIVILPFVFGVPSHGRRGNRRDWWNHLFRGHPRWVPGLVQALLAYAVINFGIVFYLTRGGVPGVVDGRTVLQSHGRIVRRLTAEEYTYHRALTTRLFSGHWLFFYGFPLMYIGFERRREDESSN